MHFLWRLIVGTLAFFGLVGLIASGVWIWFSTTSQISLAEKNVLWIDFNQPIGQTDGPLLSFGNKDGYDLYTLVEVIEKAAADPRVTALIASLGSPTMSLATAQEIREAVASFRATGKPAVLFAESFGEGSNGTVAYYLAAAFGDIWLQPSGELNLNGFTVESPFLKVFFDHLGIKPEFGRRYEYKGAVETFIRDSMSNEQKENLKAVLEAWTNQVTRDVAADRMLPPENIRRMIAEAPLLASEALQEGLVDSLGYRDEAMQSVTGASNALVDVKTYLSAWKNEGDAAVAVALIQAEGEIISGESRSFPNHVYRPWLGSETVSRALNDAADDPDIQGILLYIDSPGGSYVASDTIHHAVARVVGRGKPVIAVMGGYAASGGYFSVMGATRLVAHPGTLTGSIGVFAGKFSLAGMWEKLGVVWDGVGSENASRLWGNNRDFTADEWRKLNKTLDAVYADFTNKVMENRGLTMEQVDQLARGRIWSGDVAQQNGLVDQLGGFVAARRLLRRELNMPETTRLDVRSFPPPKPLLQRVLEMSEGDFFLASLGVEDRILVDILRTVAPLLRAADGQLRTQAPLFEIR